MQQALLCANIPGANRMPEAGGVSLVTATALLHPPPTSRWPCPLPHKLRKSAAPTQISVSPSARPPPIPSPFPPSVSSHDRGQTYSAEWSDDEGSNSFNASEANGGTNPFDEDSAGKGVRVRALYDYDGQEQDELSFKAGEDPHGCWAVPRGVCPSCRSPGCAFWCKMSRIVSGLSRFFKTWGWQRGEGTTQGGAGGEVGQGT